MVDQKSKGASKNYSSIDEWTKTFAPKTWKLEKFKELSKDPEKLARVLADDLIQEIKDQYSLK